MLYVLLYQHGESGRYCNILFNGNNAYHEHNNRNNGNNAHHGNSNVNNGNNAYHENNNMYNGNNAYHGNNNAYNRNKGIHKNTGNNEINRGNGNTGYDNVHSPLSNTTEGGRMLWPHQIMACGMWIILPHS